MRRVVADIMLIGGFILFPWWATSILVVMFLFLVEKPVEAFVIALALDLAFMSGEGAARLFGFYFWSGTLLLFFMTKPLKKSLIYYNV